MTDEEHIQKLLEYRDYQLRSAYGWIEKAKTKQSDEDGALNVAKEVRVYEKRHGERLAA